MITVNCENCALRKRDLFVPMTKNELSFMTRFKSTEKSVGAGTEFLSEGDSSSQLYTVLEGLGTRSKTLEDGRRQVISFVFPGDLCGLQAGVMSEMKHSVRATTDMRLCVFKRSDLWRVFKNQPERAYDVTWIAALEEHFLGETIATLGQRDATQRLAWAMLRIFERLQAVGMATGNTVPLPFRQQDLADALGLSVVHTNKTLMALRGAGLISWMQGVLTVPDLSKLASLALADLERPQKRPIL